MSEVFVAIGYKVERIHSSEAMEFIKGITPNEANFYLFSTSGVHGCYSTIEEVWARPPIDEDGKVEEYMVTFQLIQPRLCNIYYGRVPITSEVDFELLKLVRRQSHEAVAGIGLS